MIRPRFTAALALAVAPCLALGCADDDAVEPSVGGSDPAAVDTHEHADGEVHTDGDVHMEGEDDATEERPTEELDDEV